MIVCLGMLCGEGDIGQTLCRAVEPCSDTDCKCATADSVIGILHGAKNVPKTWIAPLNDLLQTGVAGYVVVRISEQAEETAVLLVG